MIPALTLISLLSAQSPAVDAAVLYVPPGCLDHSSSRFELKHRLATSRQPGFRFVGVTLGAFSHGGRLLFPLTENGDPDEVRAFLRAAAVGAEPRRVVTGTAVVVETPWEIAFTVDAPGTLKGLVDDGVAVREAPLVRLELGDTAVMALELDASAPLNVDVDAWVRQPLATEAVAHEGKEAALFFAGRRAGTATATAAALDELRAARAMPVLLAGGLDALSTEQRADCLERIKRAGVGAVGLRFEDLALGVDDVRALAASGAAPFVAANLRDSHGEPVVPAHRLLVVDGRRIAVMGLVDPGALSAVPADVAAGWHVLPPGPALEEAREAVAVDKPDVVVLIAPAETLAVELSVARGVDVVVGDFAALELTGKDEEVHRTSDDAPATPLLIVRAPAMAVGKLSFTVDVAGHVAAVAHRVVPILPHALKTTTTTTTTAPSSFGADPWFARAAPNAGIALPDLGLVVARTPALVPLVFGDAVLVRGRVRRIPGGDPARFSDPLWGRFIARIARESLDADVVLVRNLHRRDDVAGPLTRSVVEGWLPPNERVHVVELKGDQLLRLTEALRAREGDPRTPASDLVFTSGLALDPKGATVRGRAIEALRHYRVGVTDAAASLPEIAAALAGRHVDDASGFRLLRELARTRIAALGDGRGDFDDVRLDELGALLDDDARTKPALWSLRVEDLSATGSAYRNGAGIERFANSRETRATTPNLLSLGLAADVAFVYDAPGFAWESRAKTAFTGLFIEIPGVPPQEQADDVVIATEVRFGPLDLLGGAPLLPFARVAFDSEWTPTPDRSVRPPLQPATLPHQALLQESVGIALRPPGSWLKDLRVGAIVQEDGSEATAGVALDKALHYDVGVIAGLSLALALGSATLTSDTDVRYFVADPDDRPEDLGVRLRSIEKLRVPLSDELAVFVFADLFVLTSKSFDASSGSVVLGAGLSFARVFPL
ncbi:MAG: hypothetical protein Q8O67_03250 [Deltaproteobacteria bacterium]|nr:hypothetical protein [Deltaproteobacteria bacterium]